MSARRYEILTSSFLVAAVISSFLYGKVGSFNWLVLLLGVGAGVGAAATYFYNARCFEMKSVLQQPQPAAAEHAAAQQMRTVDPLSLRLHGSPPENLIQQTLWESLRARDPREVLEHNIRYYFVSSAA